MPHADRRLSHRGAQLAMCVRVTLQIAWFCGSSLKKVDFISKTPELSGTHGDLTNNNGSFTNNTGNETVLFKKPTKIGMESWMVSSWVHQRARVNIIIIQCIMWCNGISEDEQGYIGDKMKICWEMFFCLIQQLGWTTKCGVGIYLFSFAWTCTVT